MKKIHDPKIAEKLLKLSPEDKKKLIEGARKYLAPKTTDEDPETHARTH